MTGFPGLLGGPHNHQFGAWAAQLLEVNTPESVQHSSRVRLERSALLLQRSLEDYKAAVNVVALGAGGVSEPNASHSPAQASIEVMTVGASDGGSATPTVESSRKYDDILVFEANLVCLAIAVTQGPVAPNPNLCSRLCQR